MALDWKPFHNTASITARADGRGYYIHKVGGLFEVVVVAVEAVKLGTFASLAAAKARAELGVIEARRMGVATPTASLSASTRRLPSGQPKAPR